MKKTIFLSFVVIVSILFFNSCEKKFIDLTAPAGTALFKTDIIPMFNSKCNSCHSSKDPILEAEVAYDNLINGGYVNTSAPASSLIYTHITAIPNSHGGGIFNIEGDKLLDWISQGAKNN